MPPNKILTHSKNRENQKPQDVTFGSKREEELGKELSDINEDLKRVRCAREKLESDQIAFKDRTIKYEESYWTKVEKNTLRLDVLRNELSKKDEEIYALRSKNDELQLLFTNSKSCDNMSVLRDNHALKRSNDKLQIELTNSRNYVLSLKETVVQNQSQIKNLQDKTDEVKQSCAHKASKIVELINDQKRLKVETEINNLAFQKANAKLKFKNGVVSKQLTNVKVVLNDTRKEQSNIIEELEKERRDDETQIRNLLDENDKIEKSRDNLKTTLEENIKDFKFKIKHRDSKILNLEDLLTKSEKENGSKIRSLITNEKKLREEIDAKENKYNNEKQEIKSMNIKALTDLNKRLKLKSEELVELKTEVKNSSLSIKDLKDKADSVHKVNEDLKAQIKNQNLDLESKTNEIIEECKDKCTEMKIKLDSLSQIEDKLNHQIKSLTDDLETKDENNKKILEESSQSTKSLQSLLESKTEELEAIKIQHVSFSNLNNALKAQIKDLNQKLKIKDETLKENVLLRLEIKALRESLSNEKIQCVRLMQLKEKDDHQIGELNQDLLGTKEVIEKLETKLAGLQNTSQIEGDKCSKISEQLKVSPKLINDLKEELSSNNDASTIINDLNIKLHDAEANIADLKQQATVKDGKILHLKKKEKKFWSPRVENLSNNIKMLNVKIEGGANESENMHSSKTKVYQNDNLKIKKELLETDMLNQSYKKDIKEKGDENCNEEIDQLKSTVNPEQSNIMKTRSTSKQSSSLQDDSDKTAFKDNSVGKRPRGDIQVNIKGKKKQKLK